MGKKILIFSLAFILSFTASLPGAETSEEMNIRNARARSNTAILEKDIESLKQSWVAELSVTGSNGAVVSSGEEMARIFSKIFQDPEFKTYVRRPLQVQLSTGGSQAAESGEWTGYWNKSDGEMTVSGTYLAQWHFREGRWLIRSEVFIALSCSGSSACEDIP